MRVRLLFLGDSLIEYCDWQGLFPAHAVRNAGLAGETLEGLLSRLPGLLAPGEKPEKCFLMIGTNNLLGEDYFFLPAYGELLDSLTALAPGAETVCTSLLPMPLPWLAPNAVARINDLLRALASARGAGYLDLHSLFSKGPQPAAACFEADGVHLSREGYALWARAIADLLLARG